MHIKIKFFLFAALLSIMSGCSSVKPEETFRGVPIKRIAEDNSSKKLRIREPIEFIYKQKIGGLVGFKMGTTMLILPGEYVLTAVGNGISYYRHIEKGIARVELGIKTHQFGGIAIDEKTKALRGWSEYALTTHSGNVMTFHKNPNMFLEFPPLAPEKINLIEFL